MTAGWDGFPMLLLTIRDSKITIVKTHMLLK